MKITKHQLQKIIKEELSAYLQEAAAGRRRRRRNWERARSWPGVSAEDMAIMAARDLGPTGGLLGPANLAIQKAIYGAVRAARGEPETGFYTFPTPGSSRLQAREGAPASREEALRNYEIKLHNLRSALEAVGHTPEQAMDEWPASDLEIRK